MCCAVAVTATACSSACKVRLLSLVAALHDLLYCEACMVGSSEVNWLLCTLQAAAAADEQAVIKTPLHDLLHGEACMVGDSEVNWLLCTLQAAAAADE
jgi:hypothetical protein